MGFHSDENSGLGLTLYPHFPKSRRRFYLLACPERGMYRSPHMPQPQEIRFSTAARISTAMRLVAIVPIAVSRHINRLSMTVKTTEQAEAASYPQSPTV